MPPVPLPRRMFASTEIKIHKPLLINNMAKKRSEINSIETRQGKSGALIFVAVKIQLSQADALCVEETQTIVYRDTRKRIPAVKEIGSIPNCLGHAVNWLPSRRAVSLPDAFRSASC
jgi:hydroxyacyl-ACP dehydratase HTD2-like protein with hotdog domain